MSIPAQMLLAANSLGLTPGGVVICPDPENALYKIFTTSEPAALITLGGHPADPAADASALFWKSIADHFIRALCQVPESSTTPLDLPLPDYSQFATWALNAPPMPGAEYLSPHVLHALWQRLTDWALA